SATAVTPASQAESYIRSHFAENITLNDVAAKLYVNPVYLSRIFREKTGATFTEALTQTRLNEIIRRLQDTDNSVSEIATACGYSNIKYFYRQFKRYTGMSPGDWRIRHRDKE
ncbi:MAG: helix-turn-helix domain-containing protein, partial [Clostridiales bacterium]|nr:helix-turn-helix domain-containing protein [Clostridiales bacterium]